MSLAHHKALLIHGWAANRAVFADFIPRLDGFDCSAIDLPGHGDASFDGTFSPESIADDIAARITEPVHLFGWSLGGYIALLLTARHPQRVRSLVLCASFAKYRADTDYAAGLANPPIAKMADLFAQDFARHMSGFLHLQSLYAPSSQPIFQALTHDLTHRGTPPALFAAQEAVMRSDARALLPAISQPVLLLFGSKDRVTPPAMGEYLQSHLPQATLYILGQSAHMPFVSQADECAALVRDFWTKAG